MKIGVFILTHTRPISEIRIGILTIKENGLYTLEAIYPQTSNYLQSKYPLQKKLDNVYINGGLCPNKALVTAIQKLADGEGLYVEIRTAYRNTAHQKVSFNESLLK